MPLGSTFGEKDMMIIQDGPHAAAACIDGNVATIPLNAKTSYRCASITHQQYVASSSGTVMYRVITGTAAVDAVASSTVRDLHVALSNASTANTPVSTTPITTVVIQPGDRIVRDCGGVQTNLVGFVATLVLEPLSNNL